MTTTPSFDAKMPTLLEGIRDKYESYDEEDLGGFIVFMSSSPDVKKGMFPRVMSLCDYSLEHVGKLQYLLDNFIFGKWHTIRLFV